MKIAQGIESIELTSNLMSRVSIVNPTVIWDHETVVLVDTGLPGLLPDIHEAFSKAGIPFEKLNRVILTHQDIDHIGCLQDIRGELGDKVEILSHTNEKPYIQGDIPLIKSNSAFAKQAAASMPENLRDKFLSIFNNPPKANVDKTVADGEVLPFCGGIRVIYTPGHTPGHICLYHIPSKTLIAGDELNIEDDGKLHGPRPRAAADIETANRSLAKLLDYDVSTVVCYHGGVSSDNVNARIAELVKELAQ